MQTSGECIFRPLFNKTRKKANWKKIDMQKFLKLFNKVTIGPRNQ